MIARLRGVLVERSASAVVVECAGVGYEVHVSLTTLAVLPEPGTEVTLRVHTHAQENRVALFGFASELEREVFDRLITVKNVGPTTALGILSGAGELLDLLRAIAAGDAAKLVRIKGVGKKTADLLVVELREKAEWLLATIGAAGTGGAAGSAHSHGRGRGRTKVIDDVAFALVGLGWRQAEVDLVVARLEPAADATVETLLREALRAMARP
ncbi:MAG: Holliday junction branch migration protein RuvA [Myxococcales bacterium]|nr:Holliday junction branch migration protein RuvA [Myxococcales bacterium]